MFGVISGHLYTAPFLSPLTGSLLCHLGAYRVLFRRRFYRSFLVSSSLMLELSRVCLLVSLELFVLGASQPLLPFLHRSVSKAAP